MRFVKKRMAISVVSIGMSFILTACGTAAPKQQSAVNVHAVQAATGSIITNVEYSSVLKPFQTIAISPKIAGKVATVQANVGDEVQQGQVLFTLDSSDLQAQLQQQQANLEGSQVNYDKAQGSGYQQQLLQAEQTQQNAQITYNNAQDTYSKDQTLYNAGALSQQSLNNDKKSLDEATVALNSANANLNLLKEQSGPQSVQAAAAQVKQAQSAVNYAQVQVQNTTITSPITGTVSTRNVEVGEIASSATQAFTVIDTKTVVAEINVPDTTVTHLQKGQTVPVKISALNNKTVNGTINIISPAADKTNSYVVDVNIDNTNNELKAGMYTTVVLPAQEKDNILTVPNEAISIEDGVSYIYAVVNNTVDKIPVQVGISNDTMSEIVSGLKPGENVITEGQIFLNNGEKVKISKDNTSNTAKTTNATNSTDASNTNKTNPTKK
ncbi:RND family efflux transporter, MFP subunit [Desulfosporosinus acidiphilus SJ4]|uniref:RND family efflux transporter, MFP subunit n=1 Tax=Desulfosporosinus acidiphilus (strain DSM 22704 / JCM 16185 / SJ4) TaxID=646529 RepID=I4DC01_DESAJ|nr:efflux RND transporter periplasmic adaptor subunit [Desulfosporosinus acidiphilus]AFM43325.1 RND family efflux transporter, MFP subunit [Desulfosporosinus acidiphilus SJ4]